MSGPSRIVFREYLRAAETALAGGQADLALASIRRLLADPQSSSGDVISEALVIRENLTVKASS